MANADALIHVEVAYALPQRQVLMALDLPAGATLRQAIEESGVLAQFPDIDLEHNKVGIFSKPCGLDTVLRDRDRVEIYRPLIADPKLVRKQRAAQGKKMRKGGDEEGQ